MVKKGEDCGWVDFVQWTQASPVQDPENWSNITYEYDPSGRRIEKDVDGYKTTYVYDGGNVIAEYDGNNNLTRKYIHGASVDEMVCMIDVADSSAVYYYHYNALGSIVALSDSDGDSCQSYEYSAYGQVWAEDPNFIANPYMFTGRRFDYETGLYYYRARYYNPYIGRFLQTDPVGYGAGMNLYSYCMNNPLVLTDPSGCDPCDLLGNAFDAVWGVVEGAAEIVHAIVGGVANAAIGTAEELANAVQYVLDDIASHQKVAFYVIGPNESRLPVKVFANRNSDAGIPFISGFAINIGGEIHIGRDISYALQRQQNYRDAMGIDLESTQNSITYNNTSLDITDEERLMAHEIGHQVDADNLGQGLYLGAGLIFTHDPESWFEQNAYNRGEYYGIDWDYEP